MILWESYTGAPCVGSAYAFTTTAFHAQNEVHVESLRDVIACSAHVCAFWRWACRRVRGSPISELAGFEGTSTAIIPAPRRIALSLLNPKA
jgi:hypothetical protein